MPTAPLGITRILRRSLLHRRSRTLSALTALTVSAAVATALLTLYADLDAKLHHEFRAFGANVIVTAAPSGDPQPATLPDTTTVAESLPPDALARVTAAAGPEAIAAPFAYAVAATDRNTPVVVVGTDFPATQKLNTWWQVDRWPTTATQALLGQKAANFVANERYLTLTFAAKPLTLQGIGHLRTGGDEDSRIYLPLPAFTRWTGAGPTAIELQISGGAAKVQAAIDRMSRDLPGFSVQPVRQLVEGETRIVDRTRALMFAALVLIALTVGISVLATMSAGILERRRDFALMRALGGSQTQMVALFLAEAILIALAGVAAGYLLGSLAAYTISEINFHTATLPRLRVLPAVLFLNALIAASAALIPARVLRGLSPAALLKGE